MPKKYNVYGLGNALLDIEFEVTNEILEKLNIQKGLMTLIDETQKEQIISDFPETIKKNCGGSAANTMVAISQLGGKGFYSCKIANDETGLFYLKDLINCGLDTNWENTTPPSGTTGNCLVMVTPDADRTMATFLGITGELSENELNSDALQNSEYLYVEGYLVTSETAKSTAIKATKMAKEYGVKTALSLSDPNMVEFFKEALFEIIGDGLDLIFANEMEALKMANTEDINVAIDYLKTISKSFVITIGAKGSLIFDGEKIIEIDSKKVKAVDTVGAGDMYAAAFLYAITHDFNYELAGKLASVTSSEIVTNFGARLSTETLQSLLTQIIS
jgi:sugar/nucleoside kinase (ribokinase family)